MKKYVILAILIVFVIGCVILIYYNKREILKSDEKQVEVLSNLYTEFLKNKLGTIRLDDSCLKNIITKNDFSYDDKNILREIERDESTGFSYVLYSSFDSDNLILTLNLRRDDGNEKVTQKYKLTVKGSKIKYETYGFGTSFSAQPAN